MRESVGQSGGCYLVWGGCPWLLWDEETAIGGLGVHVTPIRDATDDALWMFLAFVGRLLAFEVDHGVPFTQIEVRPICISHLK